MNHVLANVATRTPKIPNRTKAQLLILLTHSCGRNRLKQELRTLVLSLVKALVAVVCLSCHPYCVRAQEVDVQLDRYETTFPCMGTLVSLQSYAHDADQVRKVFGETRAEIDRLVQIFTDYDQQSEVCQLTQDDHIDTWQMVSPELWDVIKVSDDWYRLSDGAFDASIGRLSVLWRKARKSKSIPTAEEIADARRYCGWNHVELDVAKRSVRIHLAGLKFDFGAVAKGYIIEHAYQQLAMKGLPSSLVRAGGDLRCGAPPPGRDGWTIEIAKIDDSDTSPSRYLLSNAAISSSGDLFQYIEIAGRRRSHVLDPKTGMGVEGPMLVTVIAPTSTEADVSDTAICVMGHERGLEVAKSRTGLKVRIVSKIADAGQTSIRVSQSGLDTLVPLP
jgi:FAD:protein FMN transferase